MKVLDTILGPSRTHRPLPSYRPFYADRFTAIATRLTDFVFKEVQLRVPPGLNLRTHPKVVIYCNHPEIWDPVILAVVHRVMLPDHCAFAPIEENALKRHWYFQGLGFFGIPLSTAAGYRRFLEVFHAATQHSDKTCFLLTPQGRFSDNRARPLGLQRGLAGALSKTSGDLLVVPMALNYVQNSVSGRSVFAEIGEPVTWKALQGRPGGLDRIHQELERRLETVLDQLMARTGS